jgi:hypothetical protein
VVARTAAASGMLAIAIQCLLAEVGRRLEI